MISSPEATAYRGPQAWPLLRTRERLGFPGFLPVLLAWGALLAFSVATGLLNVRMGWNGIPVSLAGITLDLTIYPPFLVALLLTVWVGPGWGVVPLYLANLTSALASGMGPLLAAVFALAAPVQLILVWGSMVLLNVDTALLTWRDAVRFVAIGLIAATASSMATPIWNAANQLDMLEGLRVWRGWVIGDLAQVALIGAPLLRLFTPRVREVLGRRFPDTATHPESQAAGVGFVVAIFVMLGVLTFEGVQVLVAALALDPDTVTPAGEKLLPRLREIGFLLAVVFLVLMLTAVVYTWALARMRARDRQVALHDPLTGCLNRRAFAEVFERESARSRRLGQGIALLFLDLDHFKRLNDRLGHLAGDRVLQLFAEQLQDLVRDTDYVFRWGGEEFLVLMPHTRPAEAVPMGERIRTAVAAHAFAARDGMQSVQLTVSIGAAGTMDPPARADGLIAHADALVYQAKQAGRNRVVGADVEAA